MASSHLRHAPAASHFLPRELNSHVRAWYVVHACNSAPDVFPLVEGQLAAGMKPYLLTGETASPAPGPDGKPVAASPSRHSGSLLTAWSEVREWRKLLVTPDMLAFDLIHAHAFPAGMAAVRNCPTVVYDIRNFVEATAGARAGGDFTWLARSFRVAEQFVIARAGAVVVHSHRERQGVLERGADRAKVFQVPEPLDAENIERLRRRAGTHRATLEANGITFFAPDACVREQGGAVLPADATQLLEGFTILSSEVPNARLFIQADSECVQPLFEKASALGVAGSVHALSSGDRERALAESDIVIAVSNERAETTILAGLVNGRPILAADTLAGRDATSDGRGVLWFHPGDMADLARRAAFLARNPDFRVALAESGGKHLLETRTPEMLARRYDTIYRYAWERRRTGSSSPGINLQPLTACF